MPIVERIEDMSRDGRLRITLQDDGDVVLTVIDKTRHGQHRMASVEFCCPGAGGGGSPKTRQALIQLAVAMATDNATNIRKRGDISDDLSNFVSPPPQTDSHA